MDYSEGQTVHIFRSYKLQRCRWHSTSWILAKHHYRVQECPLYLLRCVSSDSWPKTVVPRYINRISNCPHRPCNCSVSFSCNR